MKMFLLTRLAVAFIVVVLAGGPVEAHGSS